MAAVGTKAPRATAGMAPSATRHSKTAASPRRTGCTHTTMNRVHGLPCYTCGRLPDHGWVYQCRQDYTKADSLPDVECLPAVPDECDDLDAKSRVAEYLQMSPSIINGIRAGNYTLREINKLLAQREIVIRAIKTQEGSAQEKASIASSDSIIASVGTTTKSNRRSSHAKPRKDSVAAQRTDKPPSKCRYTICGGCRPYYESRLYASFEAMNDQPPLTASDMRKLSMIDPAIARTIGLRPSPEATLPSTQSHTSIDITDSTDLESDSGVSVNESVTNSGDSHSIGAESLDKPVLFPCPGPLYCRAWTGHSGCPYENGGFDDGRRAENHMHDFLNSLTPENSHSQLSNDADLTSSTPGASSTTASSVSLPATPLAPLIPLLPPDDSFDVALQKQLKDKSESRSVGSPGGRRRKTEIGLYTDTGDHGIISDVDGEVMALTH